MTSPARESASTSARQGILRERPARRPNAREGLDRLARPAELVEQDPAEREGRQPRARIARVPAKDALEVGDGLGGVAAQASGVGGQQQIGGVVAHRARTRLPQRPPRLFVLTTLGERPP